jgi:phosphoglycolate phosphatase-like HAD superfamily hydrolase
MPLDIPRIKAICFDIDGTLWNSDDQFVLHLVNILRPFQKIFPGIDSVRIARRLVMAFETPGTFIYNLRYRSKLIWMLTNLEGWQDHSDEKAPISPSPLIDGVGEMLVELAREYRLAVVSSRPEGSTLGFLVQHNLLACFQIIVTGQTCRRTKPHPEPVIYAAHHLGVPPTRCLMVGDTTVDICSGHRAGAQTVGVLCGFGEEDELLRAGADLILESTSDLLQILKP